MNPKLKQLIDDLAQKLKQNLPPNEETAAINCLKGIDLALFAEAPESEAYRYVDEIIDEYLIRKGVKHG